MSWIKIKVNKPEEGMARVSSPGEPARISPLGKAIIIPFLVALVLACYYGYEANRDSLWRWFFLFPGGVCVHGVFAVLKAKDVEK